MIRVGVGFDVHRFEAGRKLILGGVEIPFEKGLAGHSDADVLIHAVCDALLGAAALGDIGQHFPDTDPRWRGADSIGLLAEVVALAAARGFRPHNVDAVVVAERPKLAPYVGRMRQRLARVGLLHQTLADQKRAIAGLGEPAHIVGAADAALAHREHRRRNPLGQPQRGVERNLESLEVPVVDTNDLRAGRQRAVELGFVVDFDQRVELKIFRLRHQVLKVEIAECRDDQQNRIRPSRRGLQQVIPVKRKVLA